MRDFGWGKDSGDRGLWVVLFNSCGFCYDRVSIGH